ncbi:hypothetical protein Plano_2677 [Planococcus sp. PAMC 21323]|nr:hypothetical protein [Planococcus sp. PAMC 21323]AIY06642.1 hypothetical protein Plano_2677 [Planococcus sp. PAMC 21323]
MKKRFLIFLLLLTFTFSSVYVFPHSQSVSAASAKLAYGPKIVGGMKLYVTNVHPGWAGPKFPSNSTPHTNVHLDKKDLRGQWKPYYNFHVVRYIKKSKTCIYIYETKKKKTVIDTCNSTSNWNDLSKVGANAMKSFAKSSLSFNDQTSLFSIFAIVPVILYKLLTGGYAVRPASVDTEILVEYNESLYITEPQPPNDISGYDPSVEIESETLGGTVVNSTLGDDITNITELPIVEYEEPTTTVTPTPGTTLTPTPTPIYTPIYTGPYKEDM